MSFWFCIFQKLKKWVLYSPSKHFILPINFKTKDFYACLCLLDHHMDVNCTICRSPIVLTETKEISMLLFESELLHAILKKKRHWVKLKKKSTHYECTSNLVSFSAFSVVQRNNLCCTSCVFQFLGLNMPWQLKSTSI